MISSASASAAAAAATTSTVAVQGSTVEYSAGRSLLDWSQFESFRQQVSQ